MNSFLKIHWKFLTCVALLSLPAVSADAKVAAPQTIWAKADVDYTQYRADALECGMQGLAVNIDNSEEVKTLARASQQLEAIDASAQAALSLDAGQMGRSDDSPVYVHNGLDIAARKGAEQQAVIATAKPEEQYARIKEMMFKVVRRCMVNRGYAKIVLTEDQRNEYSDMKGGADARRAYIHKLASDPQLLETQREAPAQ
ncbi:hypothetical protein J3E64_000945 [Sphingobium sp. OAS761]|uniref:hypothetical protein n=1 Tax=Sphingobium sp. OAS761 TaxID=2817901 RepID=UPI0020A1B263|nr:hypothetical protein [Sphingobium sp. OAS761]MCP1469270.1 hypothetical protein [Sphingobium sp. OAS761]